MEYILNGSRVISNKLNFNVISFIMRIAHFAEPSAADNTYLLKRLRTHFSSILVIP